MSQCHTEERYRGKREVAIIKEREEGEWRIHKQQQEKSLVSFTIAIQWASAFGLRSSRLRVHDVGEGVNPLMLKQ